MLLLLVKVGIHKYSLLDIIPDTVMPIYVPAQQSQLAV